MKFIFAKLLKKEFYAKLQIVCANFPRNELYMFSIVFTTVQLKTNKKSAVFVMILTRMADVFWVIKIETLEKSRFQRPFIFVAITNTLQKYNFLLDFFLFKVLF